MSHLHAAQSVRAESLVDRVVFLAAPPGARAQVVVVRGDRGSGRTTLLEQATARLELMPVWIDCAVFAASEAFGSLREALSSTTIRLFPDPMAEQVGRDLAAGPPPAMNDLAASVWAVIRPGLAELEGRVVVADDFDLLDPDSQQVAAYVLHRVAQFGGAPVLLSIESNAADSLRQFTSVDVPPLSPDGVRSVLEDLTGAAVPHRVAVDLATASGGNPLALSGIVRNLSADQLSGRDLLPHPLPLGRSVVQRLAFGGDAATTATALLAALAVESVMDVDVARLVVGSAAELATALATGEVQQHHRQLRAASPARALAAWELAKPSSRQRIQRVLGESLDLPCAAVHRALSGQPVRDADVSTAGEVLLRSGRADHLRPALDVVQWSLPASGFALGQLLMSDGYVTTVRRLVAAPHRQNGLLPTHIASLLTQVAVLSGHVRDQLPEPDVDPPPGVPIGEWGRTVLGGVRALLQRGDHTAARRLLDDTASHFASAPAGLAAQARFVRAELGYHRQEEWALTELSRAAGDWLEHQDGHDVLGTSIMGFYLLAVGDATLAAAVLNRTEPNADAGALTRAVHVVSRLLTEVARGRFVAADDLVIDMDRLMPYSQGGAHTLGLVIAVGAARGPRPDRDRIEWRLDHADVAGQPPTARGELAAMSGYRCLVEGAYEQAAALFEQALRSRSTLSSGATAVLANLLETRRALGASGAENRALWAGLGEWWPDRHGEQFVGLEARCRALCADDTELDHAFQAALLACDVGFPVDLARTHVAYGRSLLMTDRIADAERQLVCAAVIFANERLPGWVGHVERLRASAVSSPMTTPDVLLSPTEREIVALVLRRWTNAEIARTMFMSKRTIELHLTRVFKKLGVCRKSELIELEDIRELVRTPVAR